MERLQCIYRRMRRHPRTQRCDERGTRCSNMQRDRMPSPIALVAFVQLMGGRSSANTVAASSTLHTCLDNRIASAAQLQDCNHCGNAVEICFKVGAHGPPIAGRRGETKSLVTPRVVSRVRVNGEPDCLLQSSFLEPKLQFVLSSLGGKSGTEHCVCLGW